MSEYGKASLFEVLFDEPKPACCSHGDCCKGTSPSVPYHQLWAKAAKGEAFARGFLSIMEAYPSHEAAAAVVPSVVERTLRAAAKSDAFASPEDVVFYHCRYLGADNRCTVYHDRPQFCRDYPDTPFVVFAAGCAFEPWAMACRQKHAALQAELSTLSSLKAGVAALKAGQGEALAADAQALLESAHRRRGLELYLQRSLLGIASPLFSWFVVH